MFGQGFPGFFGQGGFSDEGMEEESDHYGDGGDNDNKKLYEVLGLNPGDDASKVRKAYLKACQKGDYRHPDKGGDPDKFKELQLANDILSDPEKKKIYDKHGLAGIKRHQEGGGGHGMDPFSMFFGGGGRQQAKTKQKMKGVRKELEVTLEDAFVGKMKYIEHKRKRICEGCDGKGGANVKKCGECKGRGIITKMVQLGPGMYSQSQQHCPKCRGEGEISDAKDRCKECKGQKIVDNIKKVEVALEPGVYDMYETVYTGEGDEMPDVMAGDLHVRIRIKEHPVFKRKGADLYMDKEITLLEALTGFNFEVKELDGKKLIVSTIPGDVIAPNTVKCIKNHGMPFFKDNYTHGNLYIKFNVKFPDARTLKPEEVEGLKKIFPSKPQKSLPKNEKDYQYLEEFDEHEMNPNPEGGKKADEDEEEEYEGRQGVQCANQ